MAWLPPPPPPLQPARPPPPPRPPPPWPPPLPTRVTIPGVASPFRTGTEVAWADPDRRHVASRVPARAVATVNLVFMGLDSLKAGLQERARDGLVAMAAR